MSSSNVVGVVLVVRHGDRSGFYQDPHTYTASDTVITPLGSLQEYQSGLGLAARYLNTSSGSSTGRYIQGMTWPGVDLQQVDIRADSSEGQVITDSVYALMQGMFPANPTAATISLANGTNVTSPLGGYVYIPIQTVEAEEDYTLEGFTDCPAFSTHTSAIYNSSSFQAVGSANKDFLTSLGSLVGNRSTAFNNMYNIFDYMNVNNIHNATFHNEVSQQQMEQSRYLADYHEQTVFTAPTPDGIGNIAGQTILSPIMEALNSFEESSNKLKLLTLGIAYKPFLSLFNMTQVGINGMVDYASVMALEVTNSSGTLDISLNFRNGSATTLDGSDLRAYPMFGQSSDTMPLSDFISKMSPYAINDLTTWCARCNNTQTRGCELASLNGTTSASGGSSSSDYASATSTTGRHHVSPVVAGLIGAVLGIVLAALFFFGGDLLRRRKRGHTGAPFASGGGTGQRASVEREGSYMGGSTYELTTANDRKDAF